ncbi:gp38 [Enterobacter hormaechei]|nr:gp38 [Enterobacter hormaechei]CZV30043.1 gp38 [Enterobacter hormaechei]CZW58461.1 gp38 [Enterobacter hormaechei]CZX87796.1 gp38 [Enterobacter hormaechei]SAB47713.1 gp38 [Enterobacter hormaechei]
MRDYFAAKAMASIVRRWDGHSFGGGPESPQYKELAEDAYHIADAMLRAREVS